MQNIFKAECPDVTSGHCMRILWSQMEVEKELFITSPPSPLHNMERGVRGVRETLF
jgi:hypothetical protein